ncbi:MAG: YebC/PmpR family DNA-binding transcriptional regulator [Hydrogenobaculum sp.]|jgi:conserved hypothetical protein TIGR01033|uniref:YebC/PmpR family DNA-binding transcriptional regulator n=1 Tax=unclassified Hydrogenobaculum TaxID=2622382 RepID=UPI0001C50D65|nr:MULTISPECIES: YebC/PmpR family DNA-binding transcriptional regulator [unclassified Hydrogenobaculum]AEF18888.1 protein of unknown function DUF28 [Hydrogenobaculum sp. 3684]AEG46176.1 UPF0082 protein yeeN [Hydrogenobaculum sp. SHO]AGG14821.1 DNA-binding regulatory protein, YebC/PmpR family [Hydrogenobaculum sp. HO]AGH93117.1 DNA-binding regulatory protein, YebC/PmpR family [Hydrogenobaculum sp. SN]
MAGHSHWAQIKHKKAKVDAQKGKLFGKLIREITVATKLGGPDPNANPRLRMAIEAARKVSMPMDTIEKAIKRGSGNDKEGALEEIVYEGYGPGGTAIMVVVATDNRNKATSEVRHAFSKHGGNLGSSGCVSYLFEQKGVIEIPKESTDEEKLMEAALEAGADDVETTEDMFIVYTNPKDVYTVKDILASKGFAIESAKTSLIPTTTVEIKDIDTAKKLLNLLEHLDELDEVQEVISNFEIDKDILAALG